MSKPIEIDRQDQGASFGPGSRPSDQAPAGPAAPRFDPSRTDVPWTDAQWALWRASAEAMASILTVSKSQKRNWLGFQRSPTPREYYTAVSDKIVGLMADYQEKKESGHED